MKPLKSSPADALVEFRAIEKTYKEGTIEVRAIKGISLEISRRRFSMMVGPSGCGKTTLLNLAGCIDKPTTGKVIIDGHDVSELSDRELSDFRARHIGFVFQNFSLIPVLSAWENVEYPLLLLGYSTEERRERTAQILEEVGLIDQRRQRPNQLSGGQKQRVAIARALVKRPDFVLADEPTANLDSQTGASIVDLMRRMQSEYATTFVFSTHDPQLISQADEAFTIHDGQIASHHTGGKA